MDRAAKSKATAKTNQQLRQSQHQWQYPNIFPVDNHAIRMNKTAVTNLSLIFQTRYPLFDAIQRSFLTNRGFLLL
jgi:hypothetical protein